MTASSAGLVQLQDHAKCLHFKRSEQHCCARIERLLYDPNRRLGIVTVRERRGSSRGAAHAGEAASLTVWTFDASDESRGVVLIGVAYAVSAVSIELMMLNPSVRRWVRRIAIPTFKTALQSQKGDTR